MYSTSSQRKFWTFRNEEEIVRLRHLANSKYIQSFNDSKKELSNVFLTPDEELVIVKHYENVLRDLLLKFMPRQELLPKEVKGTAIHYFKRFFLVNSVMDYHPREMMITCIFLACKICEYVVPIDLFVQHIGGDANLLKNIILDQELELLARIKFRIHIVNPYRCIDGLLLDLRTRSNFRNPERLQEHIRRFLSSMWHTDVCLLYSPSQIALAAVMHASSRCKENIDNFIMNTFLNCPPAHTMQTIIKVVQEIRRKVMNPKPLPSMEEIARLEARLAQCRNPINNPASQVFKTRMREYALEAYDSSSPVVSK